MMGGRGTERIRSWFSKIYFAVLLALKPKRLIPKSDFVILDEQRCFLPLAKSNCLVFWPSFFAIYINVWFDAANTF